MAKSKNHTAHNQSYEAHRNGIKKPRKHHHSSCLPPKGIFSWYIQTFTVCSYGEIYCALRN
ncbi:hypothetical protein RHGRI_004939 [Rhododendron griersonianum]|uniref:60S ribosomal protein L29 n=1 Tax=Rhododendron griersonianum TaxID=479676 RepID=A0AAV6LD64_9ERIC|nr:hypothetical protein RHGRI_037294 [Rhododendron griersonianum]KAG5562059.1 hypothetical protein RHGRI_004939 [Rhododendron griersonianum]